MTSTGSVELVVLKGDGTRDNLTLSSYVARRLKQVELAKLARRLGHPAK